MPLSPSIPDQCNSGRPRNTEVLAKCGCRLIPVSVARPFVRAEAAVPVRIGVIEGAWSALRPRFEMIKGILELLDSVYLPVGRSCPVACAVARCYPPGQAVGGIMAVDVAAPFGGEDVDDGAAAALDAATTLVESFVPTRLAPVNLLEVFEDGRLVVPARGDDVVGVARLEQEAHGLRARRVAPSGPDFVPRRAC